MLFNISPGIDGLLYEFFVECKDIMIPILCNLFNVSLHSGIFPENWCNGTIIPVFKKGDKNDVNNYRGITLMSHLSKLFTTILNNRLRNVSSTYNIISDAQFGFKPGFSTVDASFALQSLITITLGSKKRLYCAFIDYSKAFDTVEHKALWIKIYKLGLNSTLINVVKSLYGQIKSCVKYQGNISESFWYKSGLIQGEALSPFLFSLFVNDLKMELLNNTDRLYQLNMLHLCLLMYADDTVLFSESVSELQSMLDTLFLYTTKWNLTVNINKSKIMAFRKGGKVKPEERWTYQEKELEIVDCFNYLGVCLNYNGKYNIAQKVIGNQGKKAMADLFGKTRNYFLNAETLLSLFDTYIGSILNYGCEVWGFNKANSHEIVHMQFCKRILGVKRSTTNMMVYSELGRLPLYISRNIRIVKYWIQLLNTDNCILKECYATLYDECLKKPRAINWVSQIRDILLTNGFGCIWCNQNVENCSTFISLFKQRMTDQFVQSMFAVFHNSPKCLLYKHVVSNNLCLQPYLQKPIALKYKHILSKYGLSAHSLSIETGRYHHIGRNNRICSLCTVL